MSCKKKPNIFFFNVHTYRWQFSESSHGELRKGLQKKIRDRDAKGKTPIQYTQPPAMVGDNTGSVLALRAGSYGTDFHLNVMAQLKLPRTKGDAPYCNQQPINKKVS
jgi:hypothetical protein